MSEAGEASCKLCHEISSLHDKLATGSASLKKLRHAAYAFLEDTSDPVLGEQLRQQLTGE